VLDVDQSTALLHELRALQRKHRVEKLDWIDALYRAYLFLIFGLVAVLVLSAIIGDGRVSAATAEHIRQHGAAWVSLLLALVTAGGLRSGSRGGPHALQPADVQHLLLAPIDRAAVLRGPAFRQLRAVLLTGIAIGAIAGNLAFRRLPGGAAAWIGSGAGFGLCAVLLVWGAAATASGFRLRRLGANLIGLALIAWAVVDLFAHVVTSPTGWVSAIALLPLRFYPAVVLGPPLAFAATAVGLLAIGGISSEAAMRRSGLVGQLRFAATVQDLRVVILLHRQLASEVPRRRPWIRHRARGSLVPVWRRDWSGFARWPASRIIRVVVLAAVAIGCAAGAWLGTTPLIVVAGVATFVAALDVCEGLAQDVDHPTLVEARPVATGWLYVRHLAAPGTLLAAFAAIGVGAVALAGGSSIALDVAIATSLTAVLGSIAGAALSVALGPPPLDSPLLQTLPEMMGMLLIARQVLAPGLAIAGFLPIALAVHAARNHGQVVNAATAVIGPILVISGVAIGFIGSRQVKRY
jgi:hypothetical protein